MAIQYRPQIAGLDAVSTVDLAAVGSSPNANGATISSAQVLNLEPASGSFPGVVTTGTQTMAGAKTFSTSVLSPIFSTNAANPASTGAIRLANAGQINWRNVANDGDISLYVDSSDNLFFTGGQNVNLDCELLTFGVDLKDADSSATVQLVAPGTVTSSYTLTFPAAGPGATSVLSVAVGGQISYSTTALPPATGTSGGIPYYNSTTSLASSALLAANQLVLGGGAGTAPATLGSLGTTTTVLHGNAAGAPTFGAVSLTADVSGTLPVGNGGTGATTLTAHGVVIGNGTSAVNITSAGTAKQPLVSNGAAADPTFQSLDLASSTAVGSSILPVANGGTGLATLTANNVILGNGASNPTFVAPGTSGNVLTSNGTTWTSAAPTGGTSYSWAGYHDTAATWSRTNTAFGDPTNSGTPNLVEQDNNGFGSVTTAASNLPGITFTPPATGRYMFVVVTRLSGTAANADHSASLTDGSTSFAQADGIAAGDGTNAASVNITLAGIYNVSSLTSTTFKIQIACSSGAGTLRGGGANTMYIKWNVHKIN